MPQESEVNITNSGKVNGYNVDHGYWRSKHRFYVEGTGSLKAGRFKFSLRERYQYTYFMPDDVTTVPVTATKCREGSPVKPIPGTGRSLWR